MAINQDNESFVLGDYLLEHNQGFIQVPKAIVRTKHLSASEKEIFNLLYSYAGDQGIFPGQDRLAEDLGVKRLTVTRNIATLKEKGFLIKGKRGFGKTNEYKLTVPKYVMDEYSEGIQKYKERKYIGLESLLELVGIASSVGKDFSLGDPEITALKRSDNAYQIGEEEGSIYELILSIKGSRYIGQASKAGKGGNDLLKALFTYIKQFKRTPSEAEVIKLDEMIAKNDKDIIVSAIKKAKKNAVALTDNKMDEMIYEAQQAIIKDKKFWKEQNETKTETKTYRTKEIKKIDSSVSDYSIDKDAELYEKLINGEI